MVMKILKGSIINKKVLKILEKNEIFFVEILNTYNDDEKLIKFDTYEEALKEYESIIQSEHGFK